MASIFRRSRCALALISVAVIAGPEGARADEAFLCGPDSVVYVKPSELELKKRTDPCIARYFGLKVEEPQPAPQQASAEKGKLKSANAAPVELKALDTPEKAERVTPQIARTADLGPPVAAPGTDYRNVRVINATSPSDQWFKHTR